MGAQPMGADPVDPRTELHGPAYEWRLWSTTMRIVTDDPNALPSARRLVDGELAQVELAASRFRADSEIATLPAGRRTRISATLTAILGAALRAAEATSGAVDPTLGHALEAIGYDRDLEQVQHRGGVTIGMVTAGRGGSSSTSRPGPCCCRGACGSTSARSPRRGRPTGARQW
jgi:hypothetical protein